MGKHIDKLVFLGLSKLLSWPQLSGLYAQTSGQFSLLLDTAVLPTSDITRYLLANKQLILDTGESYTESLAKHPYGPITLLFDTNIDYPSAFKKAPSLAPKWLFLQGDDSLLRQDIVAVVGTRNPTSDGVKVARQVTHGLMANELAILSGLAQGIDATAHITAVNAHYKRCIGVIGNGMNKPLNNSQQSLHGQILAMGGLIISEYPAHYPVAKEQLVARNRIQAILSNVVIVIEATLASGTAHTVRFASQVDTPVCAITINGIEQIPEHALLSSIPNSFKLSQRDLIRRFLSTYVKVKP